MSAFIDALIVEAQKLKGSLTALMIVLGPLSVVAFAVLLMLNHGTGIVVEQGWTRFVQGAVAIWAYLVFPLLVALQAASINQIDHAVDGWKRMFSLPMPAGRLFLAKLALLWTVMLISNLLLAAGLIAVAGGWGALSAELPPLQSETVAMVLRSMIACLAGGGLMIVLHFTLSWTFDSFVLPLTVGVVATMMIVQVGSSEYWIWHPWTWSLTAAAASEPARAALAVGLGLTMALAAAAIGAIAARRLRRSG